MKKTGIQLTIMRIVGAMALTFPLSQVPVVAENQQTSGKGDKSMMSMDSMMKECQEHCQKSSKTIDQMMSMMQDAKKSNDPSKMRASLDKSQTSLKEMKDHMDGCMNMMSMMQNMQGGKGGDMKGMMDKEDHMKDMDLK